MDKEIVVDAGILLDIVVRTRPRHKFAKLIGVYLIDNGIRIKVPMHAMFEIKAAMKDAKMQAETKGEAVQINEDISEMTPLNFDPVPIDGAFFSKYSDAGIPYLKAGDYLYVALAKVDGLILLTEDQAQYDAAVTAGVRVYTAMEFRKMCASE